MLLMPMLLDVFFGSEVTDWSIAVMPSCGLMIKYSFYYSVYSLSLLSAGSIAVAAERAMTMFELIGIPLYCVLTMKIYKRQNI